MGSVFLSNICTVQNDVSLKLLVNIIEFEYKKEFEVVIIRICCKNINKPISTLCICFLSWKNALFTIEATLSLYKVHFRTYCWHIIQSWHKRTQLKKVNLKSDNTYDCKSLTFTTFPKVPSPRVANTLSEKNNQNNN